jgi:LPS-assembly lipoprotein
MTQLLHRRHLLGRLLGLGSAVLGAGVVGGVAGCSPHPLYAPNAFGTGDGQAMSVQAQLREVQVALLPERTGQLLREALQSRLEAGEEPEYTRYSLAVSLNIAQIGLGIQNDSSITYIRFIATAPWSLTEQDSPTNQILVSNTAQAADDLNTFDNAPFGQELESSTVDARLADAIADQIVIRLAHYFTVSGRKLEQGQRKAPA